MRNIKLNTSTKYKNNKYQIKYLKAKKNDICCLRCAME